MESMTSTEVKLTVPEAARRLGVDGGEVYRLIFNAVLSGRPGADGGVYVTGRSVEAYLANSSKDPKPRP